MNKKLLTILLSVLLPAFLVSAVVYATTSVGDAVSIGTTLTVAGATTLNGNVTLGNATGDTLTVWAPLVWAATTTTYGIDLNAATCSTADIRLQNGETISNATNGIIAVGGNLLVNGAETDATSGYEQFFKVTGNLTGVGAGGSGSKTWVMNVDVTRAAGADITVGDSNDMGLKIAMANKATSNTAGYYMRGLDVAVSNRDGGSITNLYGGHVSATQKGSSAVTTDLWGLSVKVEADSPNTAATNVIGVNVEYDMVAPTGAPTISAGVRVNQNSDYYSAYPIAGFMVDNGATNRPWQYGLYIDDTTIQTADIRLSNGETISNTTDGVVAISGNLKIASPATLLVTGSDPGTQVKLLYEASEALGAGKQLQGMQVSATYGNATAAATAGVTGAEIKARAKTDTSGALSQLRGVVGNADAKNREVTTMYGMEAVIDASTGATITTAIGLKVSQNFQANVGTNVYGISISADSHASDADIQLSGGANATNRPTIQSGAGAPAAGACVSTNLGSIYLRSDPAGVSTAVYVCTAAATWTALTVN